MAENMAPHKLFFLWNSYRVSIRVKGFDLFAELLRPRSIIGTIFELLLKEVIVADGLLPCDP